MTENCMTDSNLMPPSADSGTLRGFLCGGFLQPMNTGTAGGGLRPPGDYSICRPERRSMAVWTLRRAF